MTTQQLPNYHALDESVEQHPGIRTACICLGLVIVGVVHAVRYIAQFSPLVGG